MPRPPRSAMFFFKEHLMSARLKQDAGKVDEVAHFMRELRASWAAVAGA